MLVSPEMADDQAEEPASCFRDPAGFCCVVGNRILRVVAAESAPVLEAFLNSDCARKFTADSRLIATRKLGETELARWRKEGILGKLTARTAAGHVFEHERVWFPSYPYEWTPEMLFEAGRLTLDLAEASLAEGFGLKDGTPYNILFRGSQPVFVDVLSFERRVAGDSVWLPYAQFVRTFLLPLLVNRQWGIRLADLFTTHRNGLEPQEVYRMCGPLQRLSPSLLALVSVPTWLSRHAERRGDSIYQSRPLSDPEKARFVLESLLKRLRRKLESLHPQAGENSTWSNYMATHSYADAPFAAKEDFVDGILREFRPKRVLDIGANTGHFSAMAAEAGAETVAIDYDPACVGALWRHAREKKLNILPLVVDFSRPSAAVGWRNRECPAFLQRATGAFDCVFMLAAIHHLLVTERIPLEEILALTAQLTTDLVVVEFVAPQDAMFRRLTRGRNILHADLNDNAFETACRQYFDIQRTTHLAGTHRWLYLLRKKGGTC
jgi:2-polyprenyl-3-methyl-5-hydroxy-6-metoxy-1,4-benzoquinol methylase